MKAAILLSLLMSLTSTFRVITFNIEYGAEYYSPLTVAQIITQSGSEIAILQETFTESGEDSSYPIADALKWNRVSFQESGVSVLSRYSLETKEQTPHFSVVIVDGKYCVFTVHLDDWYYQPFQAAYLPYDRDGVYQPNTTDPNLLIHYANEARGSSCEEIRNMIDKYSNYPIILGGDFNEPSHLDWTRNAYQKGMIPVAVEYPSTKKLEEKGLRDIFREIYRDEVNIPGYTWPDRDIDYKYRKDRIDFLMVNQAWMKDYPLKEVFIIDHTPSDHAALVGGFNR